MNDKVTSKVDLVHFVRLATTLLKVKESARQIFTDLIFFTGRLSNKPFLILLLTISSHLKYVTTVPCNLLLVTALVWDCRSFSDIHDSQGSVATHIRCGEIFNKHVPCCKFTGEPDSAKILKSVDN